MLYDVSTDKPLRDLSVRQLNLDSVLPVGHETRIAVDAHNDMSAGIQIWDTEVDRPQRSLPRSLSGEGGIINSLSGYLGDDVVLTLQGSTATRWDLKKGTEISPRFKADKWIHLGVVSPDGRTLLTVIDDGSILFWDLATGQKRDTIWGRLPMTTALAISPDGRTLAVGYVDGEVKLWNMATGQYLCDLAGPSGQVRVLSFSPDGLRLSAAASSHTNGTDVFTWDATPVSTKRPR
jgi:WD40 repeat protein